MYDLAIIGGGPAGVAAGVYAARKKLRTVFITETIGGQSCDSMGIENWIGTVRLSGGELADALRAHLRAYAGDVVEIRLEERAQKIARIDGGFSVTTDKGTYQALALIAASGGSRKKLPAKNADLFENKGLSYCASCDGPLFGGVDVVVVGGGNAGFETAAQLLAYCKTVTLIHRHPHFDKADAATVEAVLAHPNMRTIMNAEPVELTGDPFVEKVFVKDRSTDVVTEIAANGVFVEIGMIPNTGYMKGLVELDEIGRVKVNPKNQRTSVEGIWSAGDCTDELYHQNNIATGDGVKALEDAYFWLKAHEGARHTARPEPAATLAK
jgi:NADH-dependent peroxiredoxin subunit F